MLANRIHLFELHDFSWYPAEWRDWLVQTLCLLWVPFGRTDRVTPSAAGIAAKQLGEALVRTKTDKVIDCCSGGGGPVNAIQQQMERDGVKCTFTLTDLYPNVNTWKNISAVNKNVVFEEKSVDATNCQLNGFRTFFASFHHFDRPLATRMLADAVQKKQGIAVFEITKRSWFTLIQFILMSWVLWFLAPLMASKISLRRLLLTFVFPILPITLFFDGLISELRSYSGDEMRALIKEADPQGRFNWDIKEEWSDVLPIYIPYVSEYVAPIPVVSLIGTPK
jgi:hypothetical protein